MQYKPYLITTFGGLHVKREGSQPVEFLPQQPSALLAYLALQLKRNPTREELAAQLLPDEESEQAQRKLRRYLHELRRRCEQPPLDQADLLRTTLKTIRLDPDLVSTDVEAFEEALRAATRTSDLKERELHLARAVQLYRGDLLPGFYQECFVTERNRLSHLYESALHTLAQVYEQLGELDRAVECARRAIVLDPFKEEAHCTLMRLFAALGQPSAVWKQYQELERIFKEEFGEEPSPTTHQLMETLRERAQANVPLTVNGKTVPVRPEAAPASRPTSPTSYPAPIPSPFPARPAPAPARWPLLLGGVAVLLMTGYFTVRWRARTSSSFVLNARMLWVKRYTPAADEIDNSEPTAMTTDASGNIYITGFIQTQHNDVDYLTLKYAPDSTLLWHKRYNGPGNDVDRARSIAVDKDGNVYVTGESDNGFGNRTTRLAGLDWATIKYDKNGNPLWVARYNGPDDGEDRPVKVCVDEEGFVYVAGISMAKQLHNGETIARAEWALVKYDPMGRQVWKRRERATQDWLQARAVDMIMDRLGDVYVTGWYGTDRLGGDKTDLLTIKYAPNGDCLWKQTYLGKGYGNVAPCRIALDGSGNLYVTGEQFDGDLMNNGTLNDIVTLKYDADGNKIWCQIFDNGRQYDVPQALAVDGAGNVIITGRTGVEPDAGDYLTLKYNTSGDLQWDHIYRGTGNSGNDAFGIAMDSKVNVIVTGYAWDGSAGSHAGTEDDYVTIKYDPDGHALWKGVYDGNGLGDRAYAVAVDNQDCVIVTGQSDRGHGTPGIVTLKYAPDAASP